MFEIAQIKEELGIYKKPIANKNNGNNIFEEIINNKFEDNKKEP